MRAEQAFPAAAERGFGQPAKVFGSRGAESSTFVPVGSVAIAQRWADFGVRRPTGKHGIVTDYRRAPRLAILDIGCNHIGYVSVGYDRGGFE